MMWFILGFIVFAWFILVIGSAMSLSGYQAEMERERMRQRTIKQDIDDLLRELREGGRN